MKIVLFDDYRLGLLDGNTITDISDKVEMGRSGQETLQNLMSGWDELQPSLASLETGSGVPLESVQLRAPVPWPSKIMCMAANYREFTELPPRPIHAFLAPPTAILDPGGTIEFPKHEIRTFQHEAELVCVIGKMAKKVSEDEALDCVFGYTAGVDVSPRTDHWGFLTKSFDGNKPIGPCIVTADEIGDPNQLRVQLAVDGVPRQDYNTSDMGHLVAECVAWFSSFMTLIPGDILFMGTNHQQLGPLQDGETVEMSIEKIGSFTFSIYDPLKRSWPKEVDQNMANLLKGRIEKNAEILKENGPHGQ